MYPCVYSTYEAPEWKLWSDSDYGGYGGFIAM